ncbi:MAG: hypothetical protein L0Z62_09385 [Gemmataceae bacterium]|nr:hypothetical protein [Gemmataceae bacterium]
MTMHYLTYVIIGKNTDIEEEVAEALAPFSDERQVKPWKHYLDRGEIARMARCYRVRRTSLRKLAARMEHWSGGKGGVDARGLFALHTFNPRGEWDWYEIGGRWDGFLPDNSASTRAMLKSKRLPKLLPHDFLTPDGRWHAVERWKPTNWPDGKFVRKRPGRWLEEFKAALTAYPDHLVVCVDRHS